MASAVAKKRVTKGNGGANPTVQARVIPRVIERLDKAVKGKVNPDGTAMERSDAVREAVVDWLGMTEGGSLVLTPPELKMIGDLRVLRRRHSRTVETVYSLVDAAAESPEKAVAVTRLAESVVTLAEALQGYPLPEPEQKTAD